VLGAAFGISQNSSGLGLDTRMVFEKIDRKASNGAEVFLIKASRK